MTYRTAESLQRGLQGGLLELDVNNTRIEGATAANNFNRGNAAYVPGLDAIATVEAVSGSSDAEIGMVGGAAATSRNSLRGPGLVNLDFGIFRDLTLNERFHLQFRGEGFKFTNTPHWELPASNASAVTFNPGGSIKSLGGFGSITGTDGSYLTRSAMDERTFRFGLRLSF